MVPPVTVPGGNPVTEEPGLTPRSPVITVGPVFVTVEAPSTAKFPAVPSGGAWAEAGAAAARRAAMQRATAGRREAAFRLGENCRRVTRRSSISNLGSGRFELLF